VFFAFITWMLVSFYGHSSVTAAAGTALESGDATSFFFAAAVDKLGTWAGPVGGVFPITSVLAGIIAFHNAINRYLHSLAQRGSLPTVLARANSHGAPYAAAYVQTAMAAVLTLPFAVLGTDPVLTLFSWFGGVAVVALLVLYLLASIAVVTFFRRHASDQGTWQTLIAPLLAPLADSRACQFGMAVDAVVDKVHRRRQGERVSSSWSRFGWNWAGSTGDSRVKGKSA
ncbi:MAG: amino acid permease, partial [Pseudarthrobacter sp.]|nr:amino acid permease [Pseudarthrobacter sp.]